MLWIIAGQNMAKHTVAEILLSPLVFGENELLDDVGFNSYRVVKSVV